MSSLVVTFTIGSCVALLLMPAVRMLCQRFGLVDAPDGHRKLHQHSIALAGGIGIFFASVISCALLLVFTPSIAAPLIREQSELWPILFGGSVVLLVGLLDDRFALRGRQKLAGQILACGIVVAFGVCVEEITVFGKPIEFGVLAVPVTMLWLLGAINAINLLDGVNGLAALVGIINAAALALMARHGGHDACALVACVFAGATLGFLRYNFPHATVFLGDSGSMLIGLFLGVFSIQSSLKGPGTLLLAAPVCLLAIPFFDTIAAIIRRKLTGRSIYTTDRGHMHHRLTERLGGFAAVLVVGGACVVSAAGALGSIAWENDKIGFLVSAAVLVMFIATRMFGHTELQLLATKIHGVGRSLFELNSKESNGRHSKVRLQGTRCWEDAWEALIEALEGMPVRRVDLDVNAPRHHEGFHATWRRTKVKDSSGNDRIWRFEMPLIDSDREAGHIRVVGDRDQEGCMQEIEKVVTLLESFESHVSGMLRQEQPEARAESRPVLLTSERTHSLISHASQPALHSAGKAQR